MQILIVEDDKNSRTYLEWVLKKQNYHIITAENGVKAFAAAKHSPPDLIISDIMMPEMDGYELCRLIKADEMLQSIPFIFYTATYLEKKNKALGLRLGAVQYLTKPMEIHELLHIIKLVLAEHHKDSLLRNSENTFENNSDIITDHLHTVTQKLDQKVKELELERSELKKSEFKYRRLIENLSQEYFFYSHNINGEFTYISSSYEGIMGYPREEFPIHYKDYLVDDPKNEDVIINTELAIKGEKQPIYEIRIQHKNGSLRILEINEFPIRNDKGDIIAVEGIAHDITQRKQLEQERIKTEARLRQARKLEALGTLAGGIAHDFNNILSSIIGYTELAMEDVETSSDLSVKLNQVYKAGYRARELVSQILTFARQSKKEYEPIRVDLITRETLKLLRASIPSNIDIKQEEILSRSRVMADQTEMHQILMNLCTNAAQAMGKKGGTLGVSVVDTSSDEVFLEQHPNLVEDQYLTLIVEDSGDGISPKVMDSIFEPYFTTKESGEGTGLGLSMVHGIVQKMKGEITVQSKPGRGTRFTLYIPVVQKEKGRDSKAMTALPSGKEHILFVDDEPPITKIGSMMLSRLGYHVTVQTSSTDALKLFKEKSHTFDLVITDMTMPQITGDKLAEEMIKIRADIPIILCTGFSKFIFEKKAEEIGIKAMALKPLVKEELSKTIRKVLDESQKVNEFISA